MPSSVASHVWRSTPDLDPAGIAGLGAALTQNIRRAVKVSDEVVRDLIVALLAEGHVLIEDHPGVGKTALARSLARSLEAEYARVQCTADLLPSDVVGTNVFNQRDAKFEFHPGPVFSNVVLVDEINRTSPKTQSGLLECMQERRVTIDGHPHELARPFIVLATQNPTEYEGTYPLPEAQLDRFMVRVSMGYPSADAEAAMLDEHAARDRVEDLEPVTEVSMIRAAQRGVTAIHATEPLRRYVVAVCEATRTDSRVDLGASPRAEPHALPGREGAGSPRGARPRPARRRAGARPRGPGPPPGPGAGRDLRQRHRGRGRGARARPGAVRTRCRSAGGDGCAAGGAGSRSPGSRSARRR